MTARALVLLLLVLAACRSGLDDSDYESQESFDLAVTPVDGEEPGLPGPDPFEAGEQRLAVGAFYEGGSSELVEIDNATSHMYLYDNTVSVEEVEEPLEGRAAHRLVHAGGDWWGMGLHWSEPRDLSGWVSLHVSFRSESLPEVEIGLNGASDDRHVVRASDYGYAADGEWHTLQIPLADFAARGLDLSAVTSPLSLGGAKAEAGDFVLIDNLYFDLTPGTTAAAEAGRRLSIGVFYEGSSSEVVEIDNTTANLYLYDNTVSMQETDEALEGQAAHRLVHAGGDWWGMGVHWSEPRDLSGWKSLHVSFRSESFAVIEVGMNGASDDRHVVPAGDYGYAADGEWHSLRIPLADFAARGLDLSAVTSPLSLGGPKAAAGDFVLVDGVYLSE